MGLSWVAPCNHKPLARPRHSLPSVSSEDSPEHRTLSSRFEHPAQKKGGPQSRTGKSFRTVPKAVRPGDLPPRSFAPLSA